MIYAAEILLLGVNLLMALRHSHIIEVEHKTPKHGWWALLYVAVTAILCLLFHSWVLALCSALLRKIAFDLSLNLFRGKPLFYVSGTTTSLIDKFHNKLFGKRSEVYLSIYLVALIILNFYL